MLMLYRIFALRQAPLFRFVVYSLDNKLYDIFTWLDVVDSL